MKEEKKMKNNFKYIIHNTGDVSKKNPAKAIEMFPISCGRDARKFHRQIPDYHMTPLVALPNLAHLLGVGGIYVKNEAERLHMNSFKVMGGSYAIYRLVNPKLMIKFAAGRETTMKDFQGLLMLAGMNSFITGGYLTTRGRSVAEDRNFLLDLNGFTSNQ